MPPESEGPAAAAAVAVPETTPETKPGRKRQPRYHVVLWDSDEHTFEYVVRMLRELFAHDQPTAEKLTKKVDAEGRVIVLTTTMEHAELKRDQIRAYGKDDTVRSCKGSMQSTIEAEG